MSNKTWTMRDGTKILIEDMSDKHLINTIKMLKRNVERYKGNVAMIYVNSFDDALSGLDVIDMPDEEFLSLYVDPYDYLVEELKKRGLIINE